MLFNLFLISCLPFIIIFYNLTILKLSFPNWLIKSYHLKWEDKDPNKGGKVFISEYREKMHVAESRKDKNMFRGRLFRNGCIEEPKENIKVSINWFYNLEKFCIWSWIWLKINYMQQWINSKGTT